MQFVSSRAYKLPSPLRRISGLRQRVRGHTERAQLIKAFPFDPMDYLNQCHAAGPREAR